MRGGKIKNRREKKERYKEEMRTVKMTLMEGKFQLLCQFQPWVSSYLKNLSISTETLKFKLLSFKRVVKGYLPSHLHPISSRMGTNSK